MITRDFRKKFKAALGEGFNYSPEVKKILQEIGATNRDGNAFSSQSIRNVFNGKRENEAVEIALLECFERELRKKTKLQNLRRKLKIEQPKSPEDPGRN